MPWYILSILTCSLATNFYVLMRISMIRYEKNQYKKEYEKIYRENIKIENELEEHKLNELILMDKIRKLQRKCGQLNFEKDVYGGNGNYIPKGTIKYVRLAMKYTHPDAGGSNEDFIKCNNIYKELKEKYKEV